jgi:hypothetical protein
MQGMTMFPDAGTAIKSLKWGKMPAGTAGTKFKKPATIVLTALNGAKKAIKGAYSNPITLTDPDKSGATTLLVNGKPASKKNTVKDSTDKITLKYTGLAVAPVSFSAAAKGVKAVKGTFAPKLSAIVYTGPKVGAAAEIDLYSTTPATPGYTGSFTATQAGWTGTFKKNLTYAFAAVSGKTNNCPGSGGPAYTVTPASGAAAASGYAVTATASAPAGECMMTMTGGGGATLSVLLTFTTSGIGINGQHQ